MAARVFHGYGRDPRKLRAWCANNPGNVAMREEVLGLLLGRARPWLCGAEGLVLDAGCGTGWWLDALAQAGVARERLLGVDLLTARVQAARERVPGARIGQGDLRVLPVADGSCALVLLFTVLSAMGAREDVGRALREVRRVLVPGGAVIIWEPRMWSANRNTRLIPLRELRAGLGGEMSVRSVTLLPPLARRAGRWYGQLARVPLLRTHRLLIVRPSS